MERNRLVFVASAYSGRLLAPARPGAAARRARAHRRLASAKAGSAPRFAAGAGSRRNAGWILGHRRRLQAARTVPDRELAEHLTPVLDPAMIELPKSVRFVNPMLEAYWGLVRRLL